MTKPELKMIASRLRNRAEGLRTAHLTVIDARNMIVNSHERETAAIVLDAIAMAIDEVVR